jgi:[acyl-carrier-protein] S-malonyltransferase
MKKIAYLFPGQGAQYPGMGKDFAEHFEIARQTFQEADDLLQMHLSDIIFNGPEDVLVQTQYSQLAIFIDSMAILRVIAEQLPHLAPYVCSGLSLGEYSALCASNKLSFKDTLPLVRVRADAMNEACTKIPGTMAAVLGLNAEDVEKALFGEVGVWVANYNCPGQIVISGTKEGVEKGAAILKEKGAKRVIPLSVSGAFHSHLMQMAQDKFSPYVMASPIQETPIGLVMNAPGLFVHRSSDIQKYLISQVTHSVRWEMGIRAIDAEGVDLYIEIGCGKTLAGLNRKIGVQGQTISVDRLSDLDLLAKEG